MGEDRPQKAMKKERDRAIVGSVASGATLCDFGEVETVSKLDVERIECTDECAPARAARDGAYLEQYLVLVRSPSAARGG
jgi:hypothetical protein